VPQFTFTYPLRVIAHMVGVPIADFEAFHHWALALVSVADDPVKAFAAAKSIVDYLRPILEQRRDDPREDLLTALLTAEVEGEKLSEEEVLSFLRLMLPAGAETTYRLTGNVLFALLSHPEQRAEVEKTPELIPAFIEETLRWDSPVQLVSREATRDVDLHGYRIPKGDLVAFSIGSANRDERQFADPDRFDLHRANKSDHVSFGLGEHFCLGSHLARMEARIAVAAMLERLPDLRLDPSQECSIRGFAFRSPDRLPVLFG
jgi:cytochrome P450